VGGELKKNKKWNCNSCEQRVVVSGGILMSIKSILKLFVAFTLFSTPLMAEQVTVGTSVDPIASLVVLGGNTNLNAPDLVACDGSFANSISAAKFFINTNMPKWNVYIAFANGGILRNANGSVTLTNAFLQFDTELNAVDGDGDQYAGLVAADDVTLDINSSLQSMQAKICASADVDAATIVGGGTDGCTDGGNWVLADDVNTTGVDILLCANGAAEPTLAGDYTEIIYVTLATSY